MAHFRLNRETPTDLRQKAPSSVTVSPGHGQYEAALHGLGLSHFTLCQVA